MARRHHHRKAHRPPDPVTEDEDSFFGDVTDADLGDHGMFVMDFTPGGGSSGAEEWEDDHVTGAPVEPPTDG